LIASKDCHTSENSKKSPKEKNTDEIDLMSTNLDVLPPVYFCTVEPESDLEEKKLHIALECLQREDPSLKVVFNDQDNLGQTILQGMGELHLDIIKDRILREYKLKIYFGPLNIAYKEMPTKASEELHRMEKELGEKKVNVEIGLRVCPCDDEHVFKTVTYEDVGDESKLSALTFETVNAINHGVRTALNKGVLLRYPMVNAQVHLTSFSASSGASVPYVSSAAFTCTMNALKNAECVVIQPLMKVDVGLILNYC
jgi:elongation factor G